jgi:hypothetical protein
VLIDTLGSEDIQRLEAPDTGIQEGAVEPAWPAADRNG